MPLFKNIHRFCWISMLLGAVILASVVWGEEPIERNYLVGPSRALASGDWDVALVTQLRANLLPPPSQS